MYTSKAYIVNHSHSQVLQLPKTTEGIICNVNNAAVEKQSVQVSEHITAMIPIAFFTKFLYNTYTLMLTIIYIVKQVYLVIKPIIRIIYFPCQIITTLIFKSHLQRDIHTTAKTNLATFVYSFE